MVLSMPRIDYAVTRDFRWRWFTPVAFAGAFIALMVLLPVNYALTGFQVVSQLSDNYNMTAPKWWSIYVPGYFRDFIPAPRPGSFCDPHNFTIGDTLFTSMTVFKWTIDGVSFSPNETVAHSGVTYAAQPLTQCDVAHLSLAADLRTLSVAISADVVCLDPEVPIVITTTFTSSFLDQSATISSGQTQYNSIAPSNFGSLSGAVNEYVQLAGMDVINNMADALNNATNTAAVLLSVYSYPDHCVMANVDKPDFPSCNMSSIHAAPELDINIDVVGMNDFSFQTISQNPNMTSLLGTYDRTLSNMMQAMHAAARLDVGNILPNNFITNASAINSTLWRNIPATQLGGESYIYDILTGTGLLSGGDKVAQPPLVVPDPAVVIMIPYLCHFSVPKTPGQVFISVLVATLSMCTAGWGWAMFIAVYFAKRNQPAANHCVKHAQEANVGESQTTAYQPVSLHDRDGLMSAGSEKDPSGINYVDYVKEPFSTPR